MLREFEVSNYLSFGTKQRCSFRAPASFAAKKGFVASLSRDALAAYVTAVGPNASGKSNLLNALSFLLWFIHHSWNIGPDDGIPNLKTFLFDDVSNRKPTEFLLEVENILSGTRYRYELVIQNEEIIKEVLFQKNIKKQWRCIFGREKHINNEYTYELAKDIGITYDKNDFLPNASYVSILRRKNVSAIKDFLQLTTYACSIHRKFSSKEDNNSCKKNTTCEECITKKISESDELATFINEFFALIDAGIEIRPEEDTVTANKLVKLKKGHEENIKHYEKVMHANVTSNREISDELKELKIRLDNTAESLKKISEDATNLILYAQHKVGAKNYSINFSEESHGLQALIPMLIYSHRLFKEGGILIYDEIERSLHSLVLPVLISLFSDSRKNEKHAQLICTTHNVHFLKQLNKYQILLVEKNLERQTNIWRLADMQKLRAEDNYVTRYLAGAYGAIPKTQSGD